MNIILLGATGLVGNEFLQQTLAANVSANNDRGVVNHILYVGRAPIMPSLNDGVGFVYAAADLNDETELERLFSAPRLIVQSPQDILVCCLGTTIKQAGSKEAFAHVDYDLVMNAARAAKKIGIERMMVISAVSAQAKSPVFYTQTKGRTEKSLQALNFKQLILIKPSLLMGKRKEFRFAESVSEPLMALIKPFLQGRAKKYRAVTGKDVATCMMAQLKNSKQGTLRIFPTDY